MAALRAGRGGGEVTAPCFPGSLSERLPVDVSGQTAVCGLSSGRVLMGQGLLARRLPEFCTASHWGEAAVGWFGEGDPDTFGAGPQTRF